MRPNSSSTPRVRRPAAERERDPGTETRILDAARVVFTRRGTAGARVQDIAAEAGVNQALIHYYFGSKEELAERVFLEAAGRLVQAMAVVVDPDATLETLVERFVGAYIDTVRQTPFAPGYVLAETAQHPERLELLMQRALGAAPGQLANVVLARIGPMIAQGVANGTVRPITPRQLMVNIMALLAMPFVARPILLAAMMGDVAGFEAFLDERRRELPGFILNALRP
jgi:TetR/AcrR family transcriptional regulator